MTPLPAARWEGETAEALARYWEVPAVHLYRQVGSTNDVARELAGQGAPSWTVVLAEEQLAGRGRGGRAWASPPGLGIWLSLLLRGRAADELALLPLLVGLAAARALEPFASPATIQLKWPNDLLIGDRKLGGILVEARWDGAVPSLVIVGLGINVAQRAEDFPAELRASATSLRLAAGRSPARAAVAAALLGELRGAMARPVVRIDGAAAAELQTRDALRGREVVLTGGGGGAPVRGTALGIAPDGALLVRTGPNLVHRARSGSVRISARAPKEAEDRAAAEPGR